MTNSITKFAIIFSFALLFSFSIQAQVTCSSDAAQQLDFMLGDWELLSENNEIVGVNSIKLVPGTCTIEEHFKGVDGLKTYSVMTYNEEKKRWTQIWTDDFGNTLHFTGVFQDNKLTMKATSTDANGKKVYHQMTYYKKANGMISQSWKKLESKKNWTTVFNGNYKKKKAVL